MKIWDLLNNEEATLKQNVFFKPKEFCQLKEYAKKAYGFVNKKLSSDNDAKKKLTVECWYVSRKLDWKTFFTTAVRFIYSWLYELINIKWCKQELDITCGAIVNWNNYICEIYASVVE